MNNQISIHQQFKQLPILLIALLLNATGFGQNPLIRDQFTADPTARVFGNKVFLFPSHDILAQIAKAGKDGFVWRTTMYFPLTI